MGHTGHYLVILPSPLIMAATYKRLSEFFQELGLKVYVPELPGSGSNFSYKRPLSIEDYCHWLEKALRKHGFQIIHLLGHSNSGAIAMRFSQLYPEMVSRLILVDTTGVERQSLFRLFFGRAYDALLEFRFSLRASLHLFFNLFLHSRNFLSQVIAAAAENEIAGKKEIRLKTWIGWGKKDHTMPLEFGKKLHSQIPGSQLYVSERGSHDWLLTEPKEFTQIASRFILSP